MAIDSNNKPKVPFIGILALKNLLVTKEDLQKGMSVCADAENTDTALKEYFLSNNLVSPQNMKRLLRAAKALEIRLKEFKFGTIAIQKGFINKSVLSLALEEQKKAIKTKKIFRLVGDILVEAGMLTPKQRDYILKLQKRVRQEVKKVSRPKENKTSLNNQEDIAEDQEAKDLDTPDEQLPEEKEDENILLEPEIIAGGIKLEISKDFMGAFLSKTDHFDSNITLMDIKEALLDKGIVSGIVVDEMIEGFINSSGFKTKSFRIAKGVSPIQGKDAKMEFFFNIDYLKAGGLTEDGTIDFKDRGEIPTVEEGTMLAEKIPMVESRNGINIYGDEIETAPGDDIDIKFGKGAKLSEDGFKVLAEVKGSPKYALSGHIFVHQEYTTKGDVDYATGHINYDGNISIKGRIKSGFKVKGNDIKALEVSGGIVTADGDVRIVGGINEGNIYARGNVYAKFIHKSQVICMGDVIVEKEIVDTDIECSGSCVVENGKFISSRITAKMGVKAKNIGTEKAEPNIIKVGHDVFTQKELEKNQDQVEKLNKQIASHQKTKEKLKQENLNIQKQITDLAHVQDRSQLEEKQINSKLSSMENTAENAHDINESEKKIQQLKINAQEAEQKLEACFDKSEKIEDIMDKEDREIKALEKRCDNFLEEKTNLIAWSKEHPGKSIVIVEGAMLPGTVIFGQHSEKRVSEIIRHTKIYEVLCTSEDGRSLNIYEMQVGNL